MHFVVIAAFALVLSARTSTRTWWLFESTTWTYVAVGGQLLAIGLLTLLSSLWVIRRLSRKPWDPDSAQRLFSRCAAVVRIVVLASFGMDVLLTPWMHVVRQEWGLGKAVAVDELVAMLPFFLGMILFWTLQFPAERAIRRSAVDHAGEAPESARRMWRLWEYLVFNIRVQLLVMVVPMTGILAAYDLSDRYSHELWRWTHLDYAEQVAVVLAAGVMFLISPVILRFVWSTEILPAGPLRASLEAMCKRIKMRYRKILVWKSDGVVVNAMVMGLVPTFRYVLLSDGLLENMDDEQIEAVFGHEAGHVKHHHIFFYLMFATLSMLLVGGLLLLFWKYLPYAYWKDWLKISRGDYNNALDIGSMGLVLLCWVFGFGWVSRKFERQADIFGVRSVGRNRQECGRECLVHHPPPGQKPDRKALCPAAADIFAGALHRIALLNGMALHSRSWLHGSIASRMELVRELARDRKKLRRFTRIIFLIKFILLAGVVTGSIIGLREYWPEHFIRYWRPRVLEWLPDWLGLG